MEPVCDLEKITRIEGVKAYCLVTQEGALVASQGTDGQELSAFIALSGLNADVAGSLLGSSPFRHLIFSRQCKESIIIFPLNGHFLAVIKEAEAATTSLIQKINDSIDPLMTRPPL